MFCPLPNAGERRRRRTGTAGGLDQDRCPPGRAEIAFNRTIRIRNPYRPGRRRARDVQAVVNAILARRWSVIYSSQVTEVRQTPIFREWLDGLGDRRAVERIAQRIVRLQSGLIGDAKPVGGGVSELRIDYGPGYRVYFVRRAQVLIILLCGGDKRSQARDILRAKALAAELEDD
jgi:putative addiction module killer protein